MNKQYKSLQFPEIIVYEPCKHKDNRGLFFENFNVKSFTEFIYEDNFICKFQFKNVLINLRNLLNLKLLNFLNF